MANVHSGAKRKTEEKQMNRTISALILLAATAGVATVTIASKTGPSPVEVKRAQAARGEYLVTIGGCNDCHTPWIMGAKGLEPDASRTLSGHPEKFVMPAPPKGADGRWLWSGAATNTAFAGPWGVSYARNLTPDEVTGIGIWSEEMFMKTIRSGRHWGVSRPILPPMPWFNYAKMTDDDLKAVYAYLRTLPPVRNHVPDAVVAPPPPKG
jgi:mono/diheme cytochrome c family protein